MSDERVTAEDIGIVLEHLLASGDAARQTLYQRWAATPACKAAAQAIQDCRPETFYYSLTNPFHQMVDGLLESTLPGLRSAHFLLEHYDFVRAHFRRIIEIMEGYPCCADKTRAILARLLAYYQSGKPVAFDPQEDCTFHHPRRVFTTHEAITGYFEALRHLHAGDPGPYLAALKQLTDPDAAAGKTS